jgi:hypothetical protein
VIDLPPIGSTVSKFFLVFHSYSLIISITLILYWQDLLSCLLLSSIKPNLRFVN